MINLTKMNNINNNLKQELINNGYNEMIVDLLVNRGYDEELISTLLSIGYSESMPKYNDIINVEIGADIIESHIANGSNIFIILFNFVSFNLRIIFFGNGVAAIIDIINKIR